MTAPVPTPELDIAKVVPLVDMKPAVIDYLADIQRRQHALMSAWGGAPVSHSCHWNSGSDSAFTFTVRVPPGVTELGFSILAYGTATVTITTSVDATGTALSVVSPMDGGSADEENPIWYSTSGVMSSSLGASSGRAVTVRSSVAWTWTDVDLVFTMTNVGTGHIGILAIETRPVHVSR